MDMMSDFDNLNIMVESDNINPIERELANAIEESSNLPPRKDFPLGNESRNQNYGNNNPRVEGILESVDTLTNEVDLRLFQEMDSMMSMMHSQINRAKNSSISDRIIPETRNIVNSMSSSGNRDTEASSSPNSQENRERTTGLKTNSKKDSMSDVI